MSKERMDELCEKFLGAWSEQSVEAVLACYTEDLVYRDPNTRGEIKGAEAMGRYLTKLFQAWDMKWRRRELYPLADRDGAALLWKASIAKAGGGKSIEVDGMDLVLLKDDRIEHNEVYFDRAALAALMGMK